MSIANIVRQEAGADHGNGGAPRRADGPGAQARAAEDVRPGRGGR